MNPIRKPELFGEYQINHLVGSFRHIDHLLTMIEGALNDHGGALFPRYIQDIDADCKNHLLDFAVELRERMTQRMKSYGLEMPTPKTTASHATEAALSFIAIALDDLRPKEMRGYGPVNERTAKELEELIHEFQALTKETVRSLKICGEGIAN